MSSAIPPNNMDQIVAWARIFAEDTDNRLRALEDQITTLKNVSKGEK